MHIMLHPICFTTSESLTNFVWKLISICLYFMCMGVLPACLCTISSACGDQKRVLGPMEWELQVVDSIMWVLEIEPAYPGRAVDALNFLSHLFVPLRIIFTT